MQYKITPRCVTEEETKELDEKPLHNPPSQNQFTNIFLKLVCQSRTVIRALNGEIAATIQVQLGIEVRVQLQVDIGYWDSFYL